MHNFSQDQNRFNELFVHSYLDTYGLDACTFRVLAHLARRRDENDEAWPSISSTVETCKLSRQTVINSIRTLEGFNIIRAHRKFGVSTRYTLRPRSEWKEPLAKPKKERPTSVPNRPVSEIDPSISDTAPVPELDCHQSKASTLRISKEGNPPKDNTVVRPVILIPTPPPQKPCPPGGSSPDGEPAMFRQNADGNFVHIPAKPPQSPITRKAYAIAELLRPHHWDNCKVCFVKHAARAYAETALQHGHDEQAILDAYERALRYCHGVATDEINRGERHPYEKATPALTVWLARNRLKGDSRTVEERWQTVIARLTSENRKAIEEESAIFQEIAEKTPEIEAWFAGKRNQDAMLKQTLNREMEREPVAA